MRGAKCLFCPDVQVLHKKHQSVKKVFSREHHLQTQRNLLWTYFSLAPSALILFNMPAFLFQILLVTVGSLFLRKREVLKVFWISRWRFLRDDLKAARHHYKSNANNNKLTSWQIRTRQRSFLPAYLRKFRDMVLHHQKATWES
jgi:hypothetical protein